MSISGQAVDSMGPSPYMQNEKYLLNIIKSQLGITEEDMWDLSIVKSKVRDSKLNEIFETVKGEKMNG